ncbi:hypothetical protein [Planctopirus hydrillae]|uniref:Uncharacterized protein n=1 Tax=Planctopirus hydrillae TaxID=1841610 RepID=A0A1C3EA10_9PLAN|nr:hypothetical protein [Planctopirus hydrillae]ODA30072.1 hypothetical protein A6X21_07000 [Planctopirus hydrillae]
MPVQILSMTTILRGAMMRLTLRTLLAYLDDVLPPAAAKALGERIRESDDVQQLVSRIREVIRKRRLNAPAIFPDGSGQNHVDANFVAEYLNDLLTPEQVVAIESLCLESDVHLAEVAACHQILTLAAAEPVTFTAAARERLYALMDGTPIEVENASTASASTAGRPATGEATDAAQADAPQNGEGDGFKIGDSRKTTGIDLEKLGTNAGRSAGVAATSRQMSPATTGSEGKQPQREKLSVQAELDFSRPVEESRWSRRVLPMVAVVAVGVAWLAILLRDPGLKEGVTGRKPAGTQAPTAISATTAISAPGANSGGELAANAAAPANTPESNPPAVAAASGNGPAGAATPQAEGGTAPAVAGNSSVNPAANPATVTPESANVVAMAPGTSNPEAGKTSTANSPANATPVAANTGNAATASANLPAAAQSAALPAAVLPATTAPDSGNATKSTSTGRPEIPGESFLPGTTIAYASTESVAITRDEETATWKRVVPQQQMTVGTVLVVPEPFEARFEVAVNQRAGAAVSPEARPAAVLQLDVLPGSVIRWGGAVGNAPASLLVERGRVSLKGISGQEAALGKIEWAFQVGSTVVKVIPTSADLIAGVEVQWREPTRFEQDLGLNRLTGGLYIARGSANVIVGQGEARQVSQGMFTTLTNISQQPEHLSATPPISPALPEWLTVDSRPLSPAIKRFASLFEKEFAVGAAIDLNMLALVVDPRPKMAELGVQTLGLMGRMDGLVEALAKSEHEEARMSAFIMLREWLGHLPAAGSVIREELSSEYAEAEANSVYRLLWGYSPADARNRLTSQELVDYLGNGRVEIREMAFYYIQKLTGKRLDYRPLDNPSRREAALQKWYSVLQKDGALLPNTPVDAKIPEGT